MTIKEKFIETYTPLLTKFIQETESVNKETLPEPHLPVYGEDYENCDYKIAFVGWETRDCGSLKQFIDMGINNALQYWDEDFNEKNNFKFASDFHNHTGNDFWGFIFRFLSSFYGISEWQQVKDKKYPEILKSFVWSNMSSIERFEVAGRNNDCYKDYQIVKDASLTFDNARYLLDVFKPNIVVILRWQDDESWLIKNVDSTSGVRITDHLDYFFVEKTNTHIFWTAHPRWLSTQSRIDEIIITILKFIKEKNVFISFPGEHLL